MQFVKIQDLKTGMRLARPIYNKNGVLLFDRNTLLTTQAIDSVCNFDLLGIYILEPAEPLPPMSEEDLEFERFQTMCGSSIQEELNKILETGHQSRMRHITDAIIRQYGHLDGKVNFYQNLRSKDDYIYKHSLNVAILCTMICHSLNMRREDTLMVVNAAIVHDISRLLYKSEAVYGNITDISELVDMLERQIQDAGIIERAFAVDGVGIKRICVQVLKAQLDMLKAEGNNVSNMKFVMGAKILMVASRYDEMTAMNLQGTARSEVKAIQEFLDHPDIYDPTVVNALINSINVLFQGISVELNTGEKALVLTENKTNILRPMVLVFRDNSIIDLASPDNSDIRIVDIMKTMDNRYVMDTNTLQKMGF